MGMWNRRPSPATFVCYRRSDAAAFAYAVTQYLSSRFGADAVFWDQSGIEVGGDFPQVIAERLEAATEVLVLIGPHWLEARGADGQRRLNDPADWVRIEVARALQRGKRVIPVLLGSASLPAPADLPPDLLPLLSRNGCKLRDAELQDDLVTLGNRIEGRTPVQVTLWVLAISLLLVPAVLAVMGWLRLLDGVFSLDTRVENWLATYAAPPATPVGANLLLVSISEATQGALGLEEIGPGWRHHHATLVRNLAQAGARAVVFDLRFDGASPADAELGEAILAAQSAGTAVVAGASEFHRDGTPISEAAFVNDLAGWAMLCLGLKDGRLPEVPLAAESERGRYVESLVLTAARAAGFDPPFRDISDLSRGLYVRDGSPRGLLQPYPVKRRVGEGVAFGCSALAEKDLASLFRFDLSPLEALRAATVRVPYERLLAPGAPELAAARGKIALVGLQVGDDENFEVIRGLQRESRWGMELQADALRALLEVKSSADLQQPLAPAWQVVAILALSVAATLAALARVRLFPALPWLVAGGLTVCVGVLAFVLYRQLRVTLPVTYLLAAVLTAFFTSRRVFK